MARVQSVLLTEDEKFESVVTVPTTYVDKLPSEVIDRQTIIHLTNELQDILLCVPNKHPSCLLKSKSYVP